MNVKVTGCRFKWKPSSPFALRERRHWRERRRVLEHPTGEKGVLARMAKVLRGIFTSRHVPRSSSEVPSRHMKGSEVLGEGGEGLHGGGGHQGSNLKKIEKMVFLARSNS